MELVGYRIGAGCNESVAKRQQFLSIEHCLEAVRAAQFPGELWMAPITSYGVGRWIKVGRYDGRGKAFLGLDDEHATEDGLLWLLRYRLL